MPTQLIFRNHADLGIDEEFHAYKLYHRELVPIDRMFHYFRQQHPHLDYFAEYAGVSESVRAGWNKKLGGPRPLINWMLDVVNEIEKELKQALSWTFERHFFTSWGDENSENVFSISQPLWLITIRDHTGQIVHPGWALAISEEWGNLLIARAKPGSPDCFSLLKLDWTKQWTVYLPRLLSTMRKYAFDQKVYRY